MDSDDDDADRRSHRSHRSGPRTPASIKSRLFSGSKVFVSSKNASRTQSRRSSIFGITLKNSEDDERIKGRPKGTTSTVEISISCRNLEDRDTFSKSDPMCVVYNKPVGSKGWVEFMRTEMIENDLDPDFTAKVLMDYYFDRTQPLRFQVYDMDSPNGKVAAEDSLGLIDLNLGQIVQASSTGASLTIELSGQTNVNDTDKPPATIILIAEELPAEQDEVTLKLAGSAVGNFEFGCLPPKSYFAISKMTTNDSGVYLVVHRSRCRRGINPNWPTLKISARALCNGEMDRVLKIDVYQKNFAGGLILCGTTLTNLTNLLKATPKDKIQLMTETGDASKTSVRVLSCGTSHINTFIEYIQSGMQINCCFSIDFTCSNGDPTDPQSLHYAPQQSKSLNVYEQAIQAVGNILQDSQNVGMIHDTMSCGKDYDNTNLFPAFGFGARLPPYGDISHSFNVNLSDSPNCISVPGVLEAYRECVTKIQLYGPTNFAPTIKAVADMASKSKCGDNYYILVIITDGVITDMELTKKTLVEASGLPLSVIIIGVGEMEFKAMEELDGDSVRISFKGKQAERDIVQFVAYRSSRAWMQNTGEITIEEESKEDKDKAAAEEAALAAAIAAGGEEAAAAEAAIAAKKEAAANIDPNEKRERAQRLLAQSQLAQEVLAEIPGQLTSYMKTKGIAPNMIKKAPKLVAMFKKPPKIAALANITAPGGGAAQSPKTPATAAAAVMFKKPPNIAALGNIAAAAPPPAFASPPPTPPSP